MPHIMLTYRCNLHCSYCFANEFVNKEKTDITVRNFRKAVEFLTRTGETHIGLIGGEPTLHPVFQLLMEMLIANPKVSGITLFTNGLLLDQFIPQITHPKVKLLVNCNSPLIIGEKSYDRMRSNLDTLIWQYYMKDRVHLGINLYSIDMDYTYIMELLQRYKIFPPAARATFWNTSVNTRNFCWSFSGRWTAYRLCLTMIAIIPRIAYGMTRKKSGWKHMQPDIRNTAPIWSVIIPSVFLLSIFFQICRLCVVLECLTLRK